ncbi:MAG TPA: VOC family protein [Candidatus Saccharimonadales bacterium]|nr:VOC family protein [Candidatus Saccharimonadales bacterium]
MSTQLNPYLSFKDNARQAMEFYHGIFGGKLDVSTFGEFQATDDPSENDKVMHAMLTTEKGLVFMASDTPNGMEFTPGTNFSMSLSGDDEAELRGFFDALAEGGAVTLPLDKAPWGDTFGMVKDKFGINWMIDITANPPAQQ